MPSASKTNGKQKSKKLILKARQRQLLKKQTRNWLELPTALMAKILHRVGPVDILESAENVCTTWRKICQDPAMWKVIDMENLYGPCARPELQEMCVLLIDRSQGQVVDIRIVDFADDDLLMYIATSSSQLRRLEISYGFGGVRHVWPVALEMFPLLEELSLHLTSTLSKEGIEAAGRYCPLLKTLKMNLRSVKSKYDDKDYDQEEYNGEAKAIGENLPQLQHLELIGSSMSNIGLKAILDGCRHLESLDLRRCFHINLEGELGKRCSEQIKYLKRPDDSVEDSEYSFDYYDSFCSS